MTKETAADWLGVDLNELAARATRRGIDLGESLTVRDIAILDAPVGATEKELELDRWQNVAAGRGYYA
jgi:hypothetical protein